MVERIEGDNFVKKITIKDVNTNEKTELNIDGVFVEVGEIPTTEIVKAAGVEINEVWQITQEDLPELKKQMKQILRDARKKTDE